MEDIIIIISIIQTGKAFVFIIVVIDGKKGIGLAAKEEVAEN